MRPAFVFDPDRCTSCEACRVACGIENGGGRDLGWRTLSTLNPARHPAMPTRHLSLACNHCDVPACAHGCPANAYRVDGTSGAVLLDPAKCIGCRYCSWVCPYDAPRYDERERVMTKCTFCSHRIDAGGQPACTAACPTGALAFGSRQRGEPEPSYHGLGATGLGPSIRVVPPRSVAPPPALVVGELAGFEPSQPVPSRKITLRSEWALLLFSVVMPLLTGWLGGAVLHDDRSPGALLFLALGALVMGVSTAHLGRPLRAWRAILNVRRSWLSREIVSASLFLLLGTAFLILPHADDLLGVPALLAGAALCVSIDGVYRAIPRIGMPRWHSSEATLTAVLWLGIIGSLPLVTWLAALTKSVLFARRWTAGMAGVPSPLAAIRLVLLAFACAGSIPWSVAALCALAGEVIDRASFYAELEPASPARRLAAEVRARFANDELPA